MREHALLAAAGRPALGRGGSEEWTFAVHLSEDDLFPKVARRRSVSGWRAPEEAITSFVHDAFPELLNLQSVAGQAKPYQVRQLLHLVERYNLVLEDDDE